MATLNNLYYCMVSFLFFCIICVCSMFQSHEILLNSVLFPSVIRSIPFLVLARSLRHALYNFNNVNVLFINLKYVVCFISFVCWYVRPYVRPTDNFVLQYSVYTLLQYCLSLSLLLFQPLHTASLHSTHSFLRFIQQMNNL